VSSWSQNIVDGSNKKYADFDDVELAASFAEE